MTAPWTPDQALAVVRHPSFTPDMAPALVQGLPWRRLVAIWHASSAGLGDTESPTIRLALVLLRDALLDEMEWWHPQAFGAWDPWRARRWPAGRPGHGPVT